MKQKKKVLNSILIPCLQIIVFNLLLLLLFIYLLKFNRYMALEPLMITESSAGLITGSVGSKDYEGRFYNGMYY